MFLHHFITITLLLLSYCLRAHTIGVLVLLLHDGTDILMETSKCVGCFRSMRGLWGQLFQLITVVMFLLFMTSWIVCRLYLFPIRVISEVYKYTPNSLEFLLFLYLWAIFVMNVYWFVFIVKILVNIKEPKDSREYSDSEVLSQKKSL